MNLKNFIFFVFFSNIGVASLDQLSPFDRLEESKEKTISTIAEFLPVCFYSSVSLVSKNFYNEIIGPDSAEIIKKKIADYRVKQKIMQQKIVEDVNVYDPAEDPNIPDYLKSFYMDSYSRHTNNLHTYTLFVNSSVFNRDNKHLKSLNFVEGEFTNVILFAEKNNPDEINFHFFSEDDRSYDAMMNLLQTIVIKKNRYIYRVFCGEQTIKNCINDYLFISEDFRKILYRFYKNDYHSTVFSVAAGYCNENKFDKIVNETDFAISLSSFINRPDREDFGPSNYAAKGENIFAIKRYFNNNFNLNGWTPLHDAIDICSFDTVKSIIELLEKNNKPIVENYFNILFEFVIKRKTEIAGWREKKIKILDLLLQKGIIARGCDIIWEVLQAKRPKYTENYRHEVVETMAKYNQIDTEFLSLGDKSLGGNKKQTMLHYAVKNNDVSLVELLCHHNANRFKEDEGGKTSFSIAEENGLTEILQIFERHALKMATQNQD